MSGACIVCGARAPFGEQDRDTIERETRWYCEVHWLALPQTQALLTERLLTTGEEHEHLSTE